MDPKDPTQRPIEETDQDLQAMLAAPADSTPEALNAAMEELRKRGVDISHIVPNDSGECAGVPPEIAAFRWHWGAFGFTWLWMLYHRMAALGFGLLVLGLLGRAIWPCLLGVIGLKIYAGAQGHKLAWRHRRFDGGVSQYMRVQRAWHNWGVGYFSIGAVGIPVLAAILFPVFAKARERARQSICSQNMMNIGLAFIQYASDWDERLPTSVIEDDANSAYNASAWDQQISQYVVDERLYRCPSNSFKKYSVHQPFEKVNGVNVKTRVVSYAMNDQLLGVAASATPSVDRTAKTTKGTALAGVRDAGGTILLAEMKATRKGGKSNRPDSQAGEDQSAEVHVSYHVTGPGLSEDPGGQMWDTEWGVARDVHSDGSIYAYVDGHVKWHRILSTLGPRDPKAAFTREQATGVYIGNQWMLDNTDAH